MVSEDTTNQHKSFLLLKERKVPEIQGHHDTHRGFQVMEFQQLTVMLVFQGQWHSPTTHLCLFFWERLIWRMDYSQINSQLENCSLRVMEVTTWRKPFSESSDPVEQASKRSCRCLITAGVQGQAEWHVGQPDLVLWGLLQSKPFYDSYEIHRISRD